jgi:hypothetical protein
MLWWAHLAYQSTVYVKLQHTNYTSSRTDKPQGTVLNSNTVSFGVVSRAALRQFSLQNQSLLAPKDVIIYSKMVTWQVMNLRTLPGEYRSVKAAFPVRVEGWDSLTLHENNDSGGIIQRVRRHSNLRGMRVRRFRKYCIQNLPAQAQWLNRYCQGDQ